MSRPITWMFLPGCGSKNTLARYARLTSWPPTIGAFWTGWRPTWLTSIAASLCALPGQLHRLQRSAARADRGRLEPLREGPKEDPQASKAGSDIPGLVQQE